MSSVPYLTKGPYAKPNRANFGLNILGLIIGNSIHSISSHPKKSNTKIVVTSCFFSRTQVVKGLVLSIFMGFSSAVYSDDVIEELQKAVPSCGLSGYSFYCSTVEDAFKGCSVWQSLRPEQKHICTINPFYNRIEYHDPKLKDFPWWDVASDLSVRGYI